MAQRDETQTAMVNPIPDEGRRPIKNIHHCISVAHASLVLHHRKKASGLQKALQEVSTHCLYRRVQFFLASFRVHIHRRIRNSRKSKHLRKLCAKYLTLHAKTPLRRRMLKTAKEVLDAAKSYPVIDEKWRRGREYLCKPKSREDPLPWPLSPASSAKKSSISIVFWNCNGTYDKDPKRTLLRETTRELKADIIALVETKSTSPLPPTDFNLTSFRKALTDPSARDDRHAAGGICVGKLPSATLTGRTHSTFTGYIEAVATSFKSATLSFTMVTGYIPPGAPSQLRGAYEDTEFFRQLRPLYDRSLLFIADANADIVSWTGRGTTTIRKMLADGWELISSPTQPTSTKGRCIDLVLTRNFPYRCSVNVVPLSTNDHQGLHITVTPSDDNSNSLPHSCDRQAAIRFAKCSLDPTHPHYGIASTALQQAMTPGGQTPPTSLPMPQLAQPIPRYPTGGGLPLPALETERSFNPIPRDPSSCFDTIVRTVNAFSAAEKQHPHKSSDPLYTALKFQLRRHYDLAKRIFISRSHRVLHNVYRKMTHAANQVAALNTKIRNRSASQDAVSALETAALSANINAITRRIERAFRQNKAVLNITDIPAEQAAQHARFWSDRWGQSFALPPDRHQNVQYHMHPPSGVSPPSTFSITHRSDGSVWLPDADEVTAAIKRLSNNRAPGPSGIPVDLFKLTAHFTDDLVDLFGNIIQTQVSSPTFANCRLILLHKAGLISEPKNYRPINLTETGFRIFESLLKTRLQTWSESVLHQDQYGFRANQSCMSALFRIITSLHAAIEHRTPLFMCFLDAVKAFDRVPHESIIEEFIAHGLCPASCRLLHSVISDHVSSVFNADDPTASINILIECGVLQGGILSPLFFNMFANSILTNPSFQSTQALYADDRTVFDSSSERLQESLLLLQEWASTRNLLHDGNELLVINAPPPELHIHDKPIPIVQSAKCLGLTIWHTGKIERADLSTQTAFRTLKISSVWRQAKDRAPYSMLKGLLHRYMLPTTLYGSAFFTGNVGRSLDIFMNQILRKATQSHSSTNTALMSEFTGTIRPTIKMQQEIVSVLSRMLDNPSSHVRDAVNTQFNLRLPFATKARMLLESLAEFPICGKPLTQRLDDILLHINDRQDSVQPPPPLPPFTPDHPSHTHFIAFTDGSTTETLASGCSTIILIGNTVISSSFPLPSIRENNAAEISAVVHLLEQIVTLRSTTFPSIASGTLITDSLNTVNALQGTSLLRDSSFVACLHSIRQLLRSLRITLTVKWVKAHDAEHSSPFNDVADLWSGRSIESGTPITSTAIIQPSDLANATLPIPWHPSEIPPASLSADVAALRTIANSAILLTEDARYRDTLQRYLHPHHINFPGTGSSIAKTATVPHAHWLLHLRRDPTAHFSEHQALSKFNSPCPCCSLNSLPTHSHLFQHCTMDKLSRRDAKKFSRSRQFILSLYSPPALLPNGAITDQDLQHFLGYLTSSSWPNVAIANEIVRHTAAIFKIFHARRHSTPPAPPAQDASDPSSASSDDDAPLVGEGSFREPAIQATFHTSRAARTLILNRLEDCRTAAEFDACVAHYDKALTLIVKWARKENRPFYKPNFHRQWLDRIEHYLTIFNLPTHQHRHKAYRLWESQARAFASSSSLLPAPPSNFTGKRTVHDDIPGWIPRMNKISKLLRHSLLRHTPVSIGDATRPERRTSRHRGLHAAHHRRVPSPAWAFTLNWSMQASSPLVEAWLAAPTSVDQRNLVGSAWPVSWSKTNVITTRTKLDSALYTRNIFSKSKEGPPLVFLYDLIRGALASGEVTTNPPFPLITATAQARKAQGTTQWFVPFEAAAAILILTPIEILRQQYTFTINPLNCTKTCDFPPDIEPFLPRRSTFDRMQAFSRMSGDDTITAAHEWALDQMSHGRTYSRTDFPAIPADIPGPPTDSDSDPESSSDFDEIVSASSGDDSSDISDDQPLPPPPARSLGRRAPASARAQQSRHQHPQDRPPTPTSTSRRRRHSTVEPS